jgi:signal transduction histidine kinase/putative methionine-R-sulfoxide reductase with GAF domain
LPVQGGLPLGGLQIAPTLTTVNWTRILLDTLAILSIVGVAASVLAFYAWRRRGIRAAIDSVNEAMLMLDKENYVVDMNLAAQHLLGRSLPQLGRQRADQLLNVDLTFFNQPELPFNAYLETTFSLNGQGAGEHHTRIIEIRRSSPLNPAGHRHNHLLLLRDVTEARQAEAELREQKQLFENLVTVARATTERPALEETLRNALDVAATITEAEFGSLFLLDNAGLVTHSITGLGKGLTQISHTTTDVQRVLERGLAGWVAHHRQTALVANTNHDDRWLHAEGSHYAAGSALAAPILSGPALLGILTLTHPAPHHFTENHAYLMKSAADQMALALRNAQIYEEQRRLADRQMTLYETLRAAGAYLEPEAVARAAVANITHLTGWPAVALLLPDETGTKLIVQASAGSLAVSPGTAIPISQDIAGRAVRLGRMQHVPDVSADPDYIAAHAAIRTKLAVPLQRGERILGILDVGSDRPNSFSSDDTRLAVSLSEAIALALDNARSHTAMRQHAADLNALYTINRMIGRSLVLDDMLSKSLTSALMSLGFEAGLIALADPDSGRLTLAVQRGLPPTMLQQLRQDGLAGSLAAHVHDQREPIIIGNLAQPTPTLQRLSAAVPQTIQELTSLGLYACSAIPLLHQQRSLGALCLFARQPRLVSADNEALQATIGQQIANAVANVRLFQTVADERSLLQSIIESSRDGIILVGPQGRIRVINEPALRFLRLPGRAEDWSGRILSETLLALRRRAPDLLPVALAEIRRIRHGTEPPGEGENEVPPRTLHWLHLPVTAGRVLLGRLLVLRDVTEQRSLEQLREDLTYTMVHDLRSPLTGILGSVEFIDRSLAAQLSADQHQVLDVARGNTQRMLKLVNAILDISRLESGRMPLEQAPIALPDFISDGLRAHQPLALQKGLQLKSEIAPNLPLAWADKGLFERVLQNLIGNAIKFTPAGGTVKVTASVDGAERPRLFLSVADTGPGIPADLQDRIFDRFTTGRREESGTGLGLAFCKMVVEAHHQRIWVESQPGQGATFTFTLPTMPDMEMGG